MFPVVKLRPGQPALTTSMPGEQDTAPRQGAVLTRVLLVDDDTELCASLQRLLRMDGFEVTAVHTAIDGVRKATEEVFALIVLHDSAISEVPIIMLTARGDEADRIAGLEAGADDYLPKPFNARELVARIRAILKRNVRQAPQPQAVRIGDLEIYPLTRRVLQKSEEVPLTGAEFDILLVLARSAGKVVSRDEIAEVCLGRPIAPFDRSVDNHISNLRKKLGTTYRDQERIRSLRGTGYIYTGQAEES